MSSKVSLLAASSRACSHVLGTHHPPHRKVASTALPEGGSAATHAPNFLIRTAILLNRSPTLTRILTPFEAAHYEYNARIARALFNPFPVDFYFKAGSLLEKKFMQEEIQREKEAFRWKKYVRSDLQAKKGEEEDSSSGVGAGVLAKEDESTILPRLTEADRKNQIQSLDRKGHRNLYLVVKKAKGRNEWRLPGGACEINEGELLHEAAQRELHTECGLNMDAWIVGRHPIAFMNDHIPPDSPLSKRYAGAKTFFFKAHILAGQVNPSTGSLSDFAWLTKREVKRAVTPEYWTNIRDILSDV